MKPKPFSECHLRARHCRIYFLLSDPVTSEVCSPCILFFAGAWRCVEGVQKDENKNAYLRVPTVYLQNRVERNPANSVEILQAYALLADFEK